MGMFNCARGTAARGSLRCVESHLGEKARATLSIELASGRPSRQPSVMQRRSCYWLGGLVLGAFFGCSKSSSHLESTPAVLSFRAPVVLSEERAARGHVLVADANADGWLDVLTWGDETQQLNLADPLQRGILRAREVTGLPAVDVRQVFWLDLNGDEAADLLVLDDEGELRRFDSRFGQAEDATKYDEVSLGTVGNRTIDAFTLLDVNRDGTLDLISCARVGSVLRVDVHLGEGAQFVLSRSFGIEGLSAPGTGATAPVLYPSDVNDDGVWEVVVGAGGLGWGVLYHDDGFAGSARDSGATTQPVEMRDDAGESSTGNDGRSSTTDGGLNDGGSREGDSGADAGETADLPADAFDTIGLHWVALGSGTAFDGSFVMADTNADELLDLVRFTPSDEPEVLIARAGGTFQTKRLEGVKPAPSGCVEDFDNDARLDVLTSGKALVLALGTETVGEFEPPVTLESESQARGIACTDLDADGDVDVLTSGEEGTKLYINTLEPLGHEDAHFYGFRFTGKEGNLAGLGTRVRITVNGTTQLREHVFASHGASAPVPALHFGLGVADTLDVRIHWPEGESRADDDWEADAVGTVQVP
jgi:hypothetical protein